MALRAAKGASQRARRRAKRLLHAPPLALALALAAAAALPCTDAQAYACPVGWMLYGDFCYMLGPSDTTFSVANDTCVAAGGALATINDTETSTAVLTMGCMAGGSTAPSFWTGLWAPLVPPVSTTSTPQRLVGSDLARQYMPAYSWTAGGNTSFLASTLGGVGVWASGEPSAATAPACAYVPSGTTKLSFHASGCGANARPCCSRPAEPIRGTCPSGAWEYSPTNNKCYLGVATANTWAVHSSTSCPALGGSLAVITRPEEAAAVTTQCAYTLRSIADVLFGLRGQPPPNNPVNATLGRPLGSTAARACSSCYVWENASLSTAYFTSTAGNALWNAGKPSYQQPPGAYSTISSKSTGLEDFASTSLKSACCETAAAPLPSPTPAPTPLPAALQDASLWECPVGWIMGNVSNPGGPKCYTRQASLPLASAAGSCATLAYGSVTPTLAAVRNAVEAADVVTSRCMGLSTGAGERIYIGLVTNSSMAHLRNDPGRYPGSQAARRYAPAYFWLGTNASTDWMMSKGGATLWTASEPDGTCSACSSTSAAATAVTVVAPGTLSDALAIDALPSCCEVPATRSNLFCPAGWERHRDKCYTGVKSVVSATDAAARCAAAGPRGVLAAVRDEEDHRMVITTQCLGLHNGNAYWIGLGCNASAPAVTGFGGSAAAQMSSNWRWASGDPTTFISSSSFFRAWATGEPAAGEYYVYASGQSLYSGIDTASSVTRACCEMPALTAPAPLPTPTPLPTPDPRGVGCPAGWALGRGGTTCYRPVGVTSSLEAQVDACAASYPGAKIAPVTNADEAYNVITTACAGMMSATTRFWLPLVELLDTATFIAPRMPGSLPARSCASCWTAVDNSSTSAYIAANPGLWANGKPDDSCSATNLRCTRMTAASGSLSDADATATYDACCAVPVAPLAGNCTIPSFYYAPGADACYASPAGTRSWSASQTACRALDPSANLATVRDARQAAAVVPGFCGGVLPASEFWIGLTSSSAAPAVDKAAGRPAGSVAAATATCCWNWTSGAPNDFIASQTWASLWSDTNPSGGNGEIAVEVFATGQLNDNQPSNNLRTCCEAPAVPVPLPTPSASPRAAPFQTLTAPMCPRAWVPGVPGSTMCYAATSATGVDQLTASSSCSTMGGKLATLPTDADARSVVSYSCSALLSVNFWIGYREGLESVAPAAGRPAGSVASRLCPNCWTVVPGASDPGTSGFFFSDAALPYWRASKPDGANSANALFVDSSTASLSDTTSTTRLPACCSTPAVQVTVGCPTGWTLHPSSLKCYTRSYTGMSRTNAASFCSSRGGTLASITSDAELTAVATDRCSGLSSKDKFWTGLYTTVGMPAVTTMRPAGSTAARTATCCWSWASGASTAYLTTSAWNAAWKSTQPDYASSAQFYVGVGTDGLLYDDADLDTAMACCDRSAVPLSALVTPTPTPAPVNPSYSCPPSFVLGPGTGKCYYGLLTAAVYADQALKCRTLVTGDTTKVPKLAGFSNSAEAAAVVGGACAGTLVSASSFYIGLQDDMLSAVRDGDVAYSKGSPASRSCANCYSWDSGESVSYLTSLAGMSLWASGQPALPTAYNTIVSGGALSDSDAATQRAACCEVPAVMAPSVSPSPTTSPTTSPTASASPSLTASASSSASPSASTTPTGSISRSRTVSRTVSRTPSASATITPTTSGSPSLSASPTGSITGSPSLSPSRTPSTSPSRSSAASVSPTGSVTPTGGASPSVSPSGTPSSTVSATVTRSESASPSLSTSPSMTATLSTTTSPSLSRSPTPSTSPSASMTRTASGTASLSPTRSRTVSRTVSASLSITPSPSESATVTGSMAASPSGTASPTGSASISASPSVTPSSTPTSSPSASLTVGASRSLTRTPSPTSTTSSSGTVSPGSAPSVTATTSATPTSSVTGSRAPSESVTPIATVTTSRTPTKSGSGTASLTPTPTLSATGSATSSVTASPSTSESPTGTRSVTGSRSLTLSPTPSRSLTPSQSGTPSASTSSSASPSASASSSPSASASVTGSTSPTRSVTGSRSVSSTRTASVTPSSTVTPSLSASPSVSPTRTVSGSRTASRSKTPSESTTASSTVSSSATASASPSTSASVSTTRSVSPSRSITRTTSSSPSHSSSASRSASVTRSVSVTISVSPTRSESPSASATRSETASSSPTRSESPSASATRSISASPSSSRSASRSASATRSSSASPSVTATVVATVSVTSSASVTPSSTATPTGSLTPSATATRSDTPSPSGTRSETKSPSATRSETPSSTPSRSESASPSATRSGSPSSSSAASPSGSASSTPTSSLTVTVSATPTGSLSPTASATRSESGSPSATRTESPSVTPTRSESRSPSSSRSGSPSPSVTCAPVPFTVTLRLSLGSFAQLPPPTTGLLPTPSGSPSSSPRPKPCLPLSAAVLQGLLILLPPPVELTFALTPPPAAPAACDLAPVLAVLASKLEAFNASANMGAALYSASPSAVPLLRPLTRCGNASVSARNSSLATVVFTGTAAPYCGPPVNATTVPASAASVAAYLQRLSSLLNVAVNASAACYNASSSVGGVAEAAAAGTPIPFVALLPALGLEAVSRLPSLTPSPGVTLTPLAAGDSSALLSEVSIIAIAAGGGGGLLLAVSGLLVARALRRRSRAKAKAGANKASSAGLANTDNPLAASRKGASSKGEASGTPAAAAASNPKRVVFSKSNEGGAGGDAALVEVAAPASVTPGAATVLARPSSMRMSKAPQQAVRAGEERGRVASIGAAVGLPTPRDGKVTEAGSSPRVTPRRLGDPGADALDSTAKQRLQIARLPGDSSGDLRTPAVESKEESPRRGPAPRRRQEFGQQMPRRHGEEGGETGGASTTRPALKAPRSLGGAEGARGGGGGGGQSSGRRLAAAHGSFFGSPEGGRDHRERGDGATPSAKGGRRPVIPTPRGTPDARSGGGGVGLRGPADDEGAPLTSNPLRRPGGSHHHHHR